MDTAGSHQQLWEHLSNPVRGWVAWQRCGIYVCNHWLAPLGGTFFPLPTQWRHPIFNCSVPACPFLQGQLHLLESSFWQKKKKENSTETSPSVLAQSYLWLASNARLLMSKHPTSARQPSPLMVSSSFLLTLWMVVCASESLLENTFLAPGHQYRIL